MTPLSSYRIHVLLASYASSSKRLRKALEKPKLQVLQIQSLEGGIFPSLRCLGLLGGKSQRAVKSSQDVPSVLNSGRWIISCISEFSSPSQAVVRKLGHSKFQCIIPSRPRVPVST